MLLDKEGERVNELLFGSVDEKYKEFARLEGGLREARELVNMDEGLVVDLAKVP